jgi:uncharacterized protein (DUF169 family)
MKEKRELLPGIKQPDTIAVIQKVRPDVLLINEFDYDEDGVSLSISHQLSWCGPRRK